MSQDMREPGEGPDSEEVILACKLSGKGKYICREIGKVPADVDGHPFEAGDTDDSARAPPAEHDPEAEDDEEDITSDDFESVEEESEIPKPDGDELPERTNRGSAKQHRRKSGR